MRIYDIIAKKRDKGILNREEINFFVNGYVDGSIPDYQASALLMAIYLNGMNDEETSILTDEMAKTGSMMDLAKIAGITVDKHSTGGVGDKTTLVIAPIIACTGLKMAKMSGRSLGHTGGTIDKLESINGFKVNLSDEEFYKQVNDIGVALISQTSDLAKADKKLYALRDATATVESIPLIASSIMSKKLACGSSTIILDIKVGNGAFIKDIDHAKKLANSMVNIGKNNGRRIKGIITDMSVPLGNNIGNALEIKEVIDVLNGKGPVDTRDLSIELASQLVSLAKNIEINEAKKEIVDILNSGKALAKFKKLVSYQGGSIEWIDNPSLFGDSKYILQVVAPTNGYITDMNTFEIGKISSLLGTGRNALNDKINYNAGIVITKKTGAYVNAGDIIAYLHTDKENQECLISDYQKSITIDSNAPVKLPIIYEVID